MRSAAFDGSDNDHFVLRFEVVEDAPIADPASQCTIRTFQKSNITLIRVVAHLAKDRINLP
jgi:hypothetical protein